VRGVAAVHWYETRIEPAVACRLDGFDHYRIELGHEVAVLITYLGGGDGRRRSVYAVAHPASAQFPAAPPWLCELVRGLHWAPCSPPQVG